ncbi:WhiB family transcriptional regulator [Streptomyces sp. NPDC088258]|uniref:WhiB family transcriptional regulator n=1 Tax=Streptomyces sp. NPDC088258 TaxID=3365849 RepID=UPI00381428FE
MTTAPWRADALCAETDPELFHPEPGQSAAEAKRICMACPVRRECRDHALATAQWWGVWGGLGQRERRRLIQQQRAHRTAA